MAPMSESLSPNALLELATGYQRSKILFAVIELQIPRLLAGGPLPCDAIAARLGADPVAIDRLLQAAVALGLLTRDGDGFGNAPDTARYLVRGTPGDLGDLFRRYQRESESATWGRLAERLRSWRSGMPHDPTSREFAAFGAELEGLHRLALLGGEALAGAIDLSGHHRLLDLGGGTGAMSIGLCRRFPALHATVVELGVTAVAAREFVQRSGLSDRIEVLEDDFLASPMPEGHDAVLLANVVSMLAPDIRTALLRRVHDALPAGGLVVMSGWMLDDDARGPLVPLLFCMEDILLGAPDVERTGAEYASWLMAAGFTDIERRTYFDPAALVLGRKR